MVRISKNTWIKYSTFILFWLTYCFLYFTRKPLGIIKSFLTNKYSYSKLTIGMLDSALLLPYSFFQIVFANLGDNKNPTVLLAICVLCSGISTLIYGPLDYLWALVVSLFLNGAFQAFCWPLMIKIVSILFGETAANHNLTLGIFGTSPFAGGTLGTLFAVYVKDTLSWKWVYPLPSLFVIAFGIIIVVFYRTFLRSLLKTIDARKRNEHVNTENVKFEAKNGMHENKELTPQNENKKAEEGRNDNVVQDPSLEKTENHNLKYDLEHNVILPSHNEIAKIYEAECFELEPTIKNTEKNSVCKKDVDSKINNEGKFRKMARAFWNHMICSFIIMWDIPVVGFSALAMFSIKMIRYVFYMWLPFILEYTNGFTATKAGNISAIFEVGGVLGSVLLGFILDRCFAKKQFAGVITFTCFQIVAVAGFLLTATPSIHWIINAALLLAVGLFIGGLDNILSSSIPILLAKSYKPDSSSTLIGIINGFGTLGTFLEGPIVGYILDRSSIKIKVPINPTNQTIYASNLLTKFPVNTTTLLPSVATKETFNTTTLLPTDIVLVKEQIDFRILFLIIGFMSILTAGSMLMAYLLYRSDCGKTRRIKHLTTGTQKMKDADYNGKI